MHGVLNVQAAQIVEQSTARLERYIGDRFGQDRGIHRLVLERHHLFDFAADLPDGHIFVPHQSPTIEREADRRNAHPTDDA